MATDTFESWLLIPGNHRIMLQLKKQVAAITNKPIKIDSWRTLYEYFEVLLGLDIAYAKFFTTIFSTHPPSPEKGATSVQMQLFKQCTES